MLADNKALQLVPGIQITKLRHCGQLLIVQHQHPFDRRLFLVQQQARFAMLNASDACVQDGLRLPI